MRITIITTALCLFSLFINAQNVGIGTTAPIARLHIADSNVVFTGPLIVPTTTTYNPPIQGAGTRMMWYPQKGAFRAGQVDGTHWDKNNIGLYSFAAGFNTTASGDYSTAMGYGTNTSGYSSNAMGYLNTASGFSSIAMGAGTNAFGNISFAMGSQTTAKSFAETVIGTYNSNYTPQSSTTWNASDRLFVIGNGNTGIPSDAMVVLKNGNTGIGQSNPSTARLVIGGTNAQEGLDLSSADQYANLRVIRNSLNNTDKDMYIGYESGPTSSLHLYSNDNETLTVKDNKIGIGESNPVFPLNFFSNYGDKIALWGNSIYGTNGSSIGFGVQNGLFQIHSNQLSDDIAFGYGSSSNFTEQMRIKGNGNVGIGTNDPFSKLHIKSTDINPMIIEGGNQMYVTIAENNNNIGYIGSFSGNPTDMELGTYNGNTSGSVILSTNNSPKLTVINNGNVGIGTSSPAYKLHIGVSNSGLRVEGPAAASSGGAAFAIGGNGEIQIDKPGIVGGRFIIKELGNVGIGNNNPGYKLDVTGDINASGNVRANGVILSSDARFKQNISTIPDALTGLLQLRGTNYFFNTAAFPERNFSADKQMGVIAQEVEKVFPELVSTDKEGYKSVNYIGLIPVMLEGIKEQQQQISSQQQQINQQQQQIDELKKLVDRIIKK